MKKRTKELSRRLVAAAALTLGALFSVAAVGCSLIPPGWGLGISAEKDGKSLGGECHKNADGTWTCTIDAHLDGRAHEE